MIEPPLKGEEERHTVIISDAVHIFHTLKKRRRVYLLLFDNKPPKRKTEELELYQDCVAQIQRTKERRFKNRPSVLFSV